METSKKPQENSLKYLIQSLVTAMGKKDPYIKSHSERVATNSVHFARSLGLNQKEINQIYIAGLLHDIGIIYVPTEYTKKQDQLSEEETKALKKHPIISEKIASKHRILNGVLPIIRHHHEAIDGSGYPDGLKGNQIPLGARIIQLVNCYDAMTSPPSPTKSMSRQEVVVEIRNKSGKQFDQDLAAKFIHFIESSAPPIDKGGSVPEKKADPENSPDRPSGAKERESVDEIIQKIIKKFKKGEIDLPVLPKVVQDIQMIMLKPSTTVNDLASIIERDAVISVKLIAVANSPVYRGTERIQTVKQAIPRLGMKETQSIVTAIANKSLYSVKDTYFKTTMQKLWKHSLASAYMAGAIARELSLGDGDHYFFLGLIHDIGKVLLLKAFGDIYSHNRSMDIREIMDTIQDAHTSFGGTILRKWGFSEGIARISLLHQGPRFRPDTDKEILVVNLAGKMATKIGYAVFDEKVDLSTLDSARMLAVDGGTIDELCEEIEEKMKATSAKF